MTTVALPERLVDVRTGELVDATPENAADLLNIAREMRTRLLDLVKDCEAVLIAESRRQGTKTLHLAASTITVSGGTETVYDVGELGKLLGLGLPPDRFAELVQETVSYKIDARVAKQLEASNDAYAAVIRRARSVIEKPWRVSVR